MSSREESVEPSTVRFRDLGNEAVAGLFARPGRMVLTVLGTVIGLAALVATLGLSRTAGNQVVGRFDEVAATEVTVTSRPPGLSPLTNELPWTGPEQLERLNGVAAAGTMSTVDTGRSLISTSPIRDPQNQTDFNLTVRAVSPSLFEAVRAQLRTGRLFDLGHSERDDRVAVVGGNAADRLGLRNLNQLPSIAVGDELYSVVGIVDSVARQNDLMSAVMIPEGTARSLYGLQAPEQVVVETDIGANRLIAGQVRLALRPDNPDGLKVIAAPEQRRVRDNVQSDLDLLFLMLGGVSLLVGAIGIANVTLVSVMERTGEIGLRRALGATRRHIAAQFLFESGAMGVVGGIVGASVGTLVVVGVSAYQSWSPVLDPLIPIAAPLLGGLTGLVAGAYPALRAARMEPVDALRSGT